MGYSSILCTTEDRIAFITLNKPDRRNSLDDVMIRELTEACSAVNRDQGIRVVVLTGKGESFCAGMDLAYLRRFSNLSHEENLDDARNLVRLLVQINQMKKPVIAMVNGPALGGGCGVAAACDFVYAARGNARLGVPEVKLGFVPAVILVFLIKRMGEGRAREFVLRGDILDAETAQGRGLVNEIIEDDVLRPTVRDAALKLAATTSPSSIALTKDLFARIDDMKVGDILDYAANLNALTRKTEDFRKGIASFLGKEKFEW